MKPRNTLGATIFYLSLCVVVGLLLILLGVSFISGNEEFGPSVLLFIVGGIFIFMGIFAIVSTIKNRPDRNNLKINGQKCSGVILKIVPDFNTTLNGRHPEIAVCHVVDSYTGETFEVTSAGYMSDLTKYVMREVDVYIDRYDKSRYFVDIEKLAGEALPKAPENSGINDYRR